MSRNVEYDKELSQLRASFGDGVFAYQAEPLFNRAGRMVIGKCVEPSQWAAEAQSICDKMLTTYEAKDADYAADGKPMGNLRMSEEVGVDAWRGVLIRMGDKRRRIESFANKGTYAVDTEKLDDTMIDLANYCLLGLVLFREKVNEIVASVTEEEEKDKESRYWRMVDQNFRLQTCYQKIAQIAIYLTILFRKGISDKDVLPWNHSLEWQDLLTAYKEIADFAKTF